MVKAIIALLALTSAAAPLAAAESEYPRIIRTRHEAVDQKMGGNFVIFSERRNIFSTVGATSDCIDLPATPVSGSAAWCSNPAIFGPVRERLRNRKSQSDLARRE
jgi:hypothetical protein